MQDSDLPAFRPPPWLRGCHRQTVGGAFLAPPALPTARPAERLTVDLEDGEKLLLVRNRPAGRPRGRLLLLHGLGGCAESRHLRHLTEAAVPRGWETVRVNGRGAGEGMPLSPHIPHAGCWADVAAVIAASPFSDAAAGSPLIGVGVSLGGSILLSHLGRTGDASGLDGAMALNPPTDLAWSLAELERPANSLYHLYYTTLLRRDMRRRARLYPDRYRPPAWARHRSVRAIDEAYVAADAGFTSAAAYYAGCSASDHMAGIKTPTWVLTARDDPFVPLAMLRRDLAGAPGVRLTVQPAGGHLGYLERRNGRLSFWGSRAVLAGAAILAGS
ncbi:MAG: YheT family hydrolase [Acidobacteriota bacterium]